MRKRYKAIGLGGTFDHFHTGHKQFISFAASLSSTLFIGITEQKLSRGKHLSELIEPLRMRASRVKSFCKKLQVRCEISTLINVYGPTLSNTKIKALAVTEETQRGADQINVAREKLKLPKLQVYICPLFAAKNGKPLHAEDIRGGLISRTGIVYGDAFSNDLRLSANQREVFVQPQGKIITQPTANQPSFTAVVGDTSLEYFIENTLPYDLGIFDKMRERQAVESRIIDALKPDLTTVNPRGVITIDLVQTLKKSLDKKRKHIFVQGEEDLAAVALVLMLPLQSAIYYGQPKQGIIEMIVTERLKNKVYDVLTQS